MFQITIISGSEPVFLGGMQLEVYFGEEGVAGSDVYHTNSPIALCYDPDYDTLYFINDVGHTPFRYVDPYTKEAVILTYPWAVNSNPAACSYGITASYDQVMFIADVNRIVSYDTVLGAFDETSMNSVFSSVSLELTLIASARYYPRLVAYDSISVSLYSLELDSNVYSYLSHDEVYGVFLTGDGSFAFYLSQSPWPCINIYDYSSTSTTFYVGYRGMFKAFSFNVLLLTVLH